MYRYICLLLLACLGISGVAKTTPEFQKQNLKVLYVGNRPDMPLPDYYTAQLGEERFLDYKVRMGAFESILKEYFTEVKAIDGRDYSEQMSDDYDVTIFDALPKPIIPPVIEKDPLTGFVKKMERGKYLSDNFDRPAVFISHIADEIGTKLRLKLDWYCLCLFYHALNIRTEHPIFHEPFDVNITLESRPTPEDFYLYPQDWVLPREIPMWRVERDSSRIGLVSGWYGLQEGNDAEIISGGHCMKAYENMAIGRHGNFLLWGFGAAPDRMMEEAKTVFANAVCYITRFAGQKPVVRKAGPITLRDKIQNFLVVLTPQGYQTYLKGVKTYNEWLAKKKNTLKRLATKDLTQADKTWLDKKPMEPWSHLEYAKKNSQFGLLYDYNMDMEAVRKYLAENMEYFYSGHDINKEFIVDEDVKSIGISNRDVRLLDKCVAMLENGNEPERALRILKRYTNQHFDVAADWKKWLDTYRDQLFFSELSGYKYLGDGSQNQKLETSSGEERERLVTIRAERSGEGENQEIKLFFNIKKGHHIYASGGKDCPFILTKISMIYPQGVEQSGEMQRPPSEKYAGEEGVSIYHGNVVFVQKIKVIDSAIVAGKEIQCEVEYQCCNADMCFPPEKEVYRVKL